MFDVSNHAPLNEHLHETKDIGMLGQQIPIQPTGVVVLAVGVVVATLRTPRLVAHYEHGHAP